MKKFFFLLSTSASLWASQALIVDPDYSPYMGAYDLLTTHHILEYGVDYFRSDKPRDTTLRVWGRAIEQIFLWNTFNTLLSVTQHEVFGHGYRLRELGVSNISYMISNIGGSTSFSFDPNEFPFGELNAVTVAGLEAQAILAQKIKMNWVGDGCIDGRLATAYALSQQSIFWYTLITKLGDTSEGNDVQAYKEFLKASYSHNISNGKLLTWAAFSWLDPMTFYAYFSWFYYVATGCDWQFPMICLKRGVCFLPNIRIGFAPYAPEAYLEGFFSIDGSPLYLYAKGGKRSVGVGFAYDDLLCFDKGALGLHFDAWVHNKFVTSATYGDFLEGRKVNVSSLKDKIWGAAATITGRVQLKGAVSFFGEIGGKTRGYLPGYQLDSGLVVRFGFWYGGCQ